MDASVHSYIMGVGCIKAPTCDTALTSCDTALTSCDSTLDADCCLTHRWLLTHTMGAPWSVMTASMVRMYSTIL
jgi:hypothetical protein